MHSHGIYCVIAAMICERKGLKEFRISHQEMIKGMAGCVRPRRSASIRSWEQKQPRDQERGREPPVAHLVCGMQGYSTGIGRAVLPPMTAAMTARQKTSSGRERATKIVGSILEQYLPPFTPYLPSLLCLALNEVVIEGNYFKPRLPRCDTCLYVRCPSVDFVHAKDAPLNS